MRRLYMLFSIYFVDMYSKLSIGNFFFLRDEPNYNLYY